MIRLALDAGHGYKRGLPTGARGNGLIEDDVALDFVRRIGHHLRLAKHETVLTRPDDKFVELKQRGKIAKAGKCDLFLSIHLNAADSPNAEGVEALVAKGDTRSKRIAELLVGIVTQAGMKSRGVKWDSQGQHKSLRVLQDTYHAMPAVLLEIGFLTNVKDAAQLRDPQWQERVSIEIAAALSQ